MGEVFNGNPYLTSNLTPYQTSADRQTSGFTRSNPLLTL